MKKIFKMILVFGFLLVLPVIAMAFITSIVNPSLYRKWPAPLWFSIPAWGCISFTLIGFFGWVIMEHKGKIISGIKEFINS